MILTMDVINDSTVTRDEEARDYPGVTDARPEMARAGGRLIASELAGGRMKAALKILAVDIDGRRRATLDLSAVFTDHEA